MCCLALKLARKDVQLDTALSHRRTLGKAWVKMLSRIYRNAFEIVWGQSNPTLTSENEATQNFSPYPTRGPWTPESLGLNMLKILMIAAR